MRKLYFFVICSMIAASLTAQTDSSVAYARYKFTWVSDTTQPENPVKNNMLLSIGTHLSRYGYDNKMPASIPVGSISAGTMSASNVPINSPVPSMGLLKYNNTYVKDIANNKMNWLVLPVMSDKLFAVIEDAHPINWNISSDTKTILGMPCQKATGRFKGRDYEAWFTSQLPYSNGPWKLGGLPGLIVEAYDTKKELVFELTSFESAAGKSELIEIPANVMKTSPKEYKEYREALKRDAAAGKGAAGGMMVVSGRMIGPDGKAAKPRQDNNPMEKE